MDQKNAVKLLDNTFNQDFDLERFSVFIKELFNHFNLRINEDIPLRKEYYDYIKRMDSLGIYSDDNGDSIEVFAVQLKKTSSRDRARTMQRNLVAKYLKNSGSNAALVAFYGDDPEDWRFSFVKIEYDLIKDEKGNLNVKEDLTPARRSSFLVGKNEPNHTCRRQFFSLIKEENVDPLLEQIEEAFSIESVTKEFFEEYKKLFLKLKESLEQVIENDDVVRNEFEKKNIPTLDFAKKLIGQIVFIYFLQKKGWLGIEKGEKWGNGPRNFLRKLFNKEMVDYANFFNDILEPLFYEALATPRDEDYYRHFDCKIPFLNGGLFEPINDYDWVKTEITLKNKIFKDILDVFDLYNFTIKEDEPLEKEVAVDPEMLGKVFENLLEVKDRKSQGAFYTPREIVHYMCQESLINYLNTNSDLPRGDLEKFIHLGDFALDQLIRELIEFGKLREDSEYGLSASIKENHQKLDVLLQDIKVVDPAVGSGAFPVGMMNEIVKARSILSFLSGEEKSNYQLKLETIRDCLYGVDIDSSAVDIAKLRFWLSLVVDEEDIETIDPLPNIDHKIMCGNSLLEGFDGKKLFDENLLGEIIIDHSAELEKIDKERSKLYIELGMIHTGKIKDETRKKDIEKEIKKLDNEEKKLESLGNDFGQQFTLDDDYKTRRIKESQRKLKLLDKTHKKFFNEQNTKKKKKYREEFERIEWEFIEETLHEDGNESSMLKLEEYKKNKSKPFFLWKLYFHEVFQRKFPGFDIVIANPPYIEFKRLDSNQKREFKNIFNSAKGKYDIYVIFIEHAKKLLRSGGSMVFINPTMFMKRDYGKAIRTFIGENYQILDIIDFADIQIFENATNYTGIFIFKNDISDTYQFNYKKFNSVKSRVTPSKFINSLNLKSSTDISEYYPVDNEDLFEPVWNFKYPEIKKLMLKISDNNMALSDVTESIFQGISSGKDEVFYIDDKIINDFKIEKEITYPLLKGKDIKKYKLSWSGKYVLYPYDNNSKVFEEELLSKKYPNAYAYLKEKRSKLSGRGYFDKSNKLWYELWNQRKKTNFQKMRIIVPEISQNNNFMISNEFYGNTKTYHIILKEDDLDSYKFVLALLNSELIQFYFQNISVPKAGGFFAYKTQFLQHLPIKTPDDLQKMEIITLVDEILNRNNNLNFLLKKIDQIIYKLYGLNDTDIQIIRRYLNSEEE